MSLNKALIGTDVLFDLVCKNTGNDSARIVFSACETGMLDGYVSSHSLLKLIEKVSNKNGTVKSLDTVRSTVSIITTMLKVIDVRKADISAALSRLGGRKTFEDELLLVLKEQNKLDYAVSDRAPGSKQIISTADLIKKVKENRL